MKYYVTVLLIFLCFGLYFAAAYAVEEEGVALPIVMYHSMLKDSERIGKYVVSPEDFENDLKFLSENGYETVTISDLTAFVYKGAKLPKKPIMLTFDDGYYNNLIYAEPLLKKYNMRAVLSVIGRYSDEYTESGEKNPYYSHLTWEDVESLSKGGVFEIQNHSYDLHTMSKNRSGSMKNSWESENDYHDVFVSDTERCKACLEAVGVNAECYTYPFGTYCAEAERYIRSMGFRASLSCTEGMNYISADKECLFLLKRTNRPGGVDSDKFFAKLLK